MNPSIVWEFYKKKCVTYNLREKELCKIPEAKTIYVVESLSFREIFFGIPLMIVLNKSYHLRALKTT